MQLNEYQEKAKVTAQYDNMGKNFIYPTLGLAGETGEVVEKIKKLIRNESVTDAACISGEKLREIEKEMGDVLWYLAQLATELKLDLDTIAVVNLAKLASRNERGVIKSEGDNR